MVNSCVNAHSFQILQSAICKPAHNERVSISSGNDAARSYKVEGFAYTGSGTNINRVELTLDGGNTWKYCIKRYVDKPLRCVPMVLR